MRLIRLKAVLDRTGLSRSVIYALMADGQFPRPAKAYSGARTNYWVEGEVDDWVAARVADRETEAA